MLPLYLYQMTMPPDDPKLLQVETSVLNPNAFLVLSQGNNLYLFDILQSRVRPQQKFVLTEILDPIPTVSLMHGRTNALQPRELKIVSFSQYDIRLGHSGVLPFTLILMSDKGQLFTLCPVFPERIMMQKLYFAFLQHYL